MLNEIILPGDKFDLEMINFEKNSKKITYSSKIYDIIEEDKIKAAMPMQKGAVLPLAVNTKYNLYIYTGSGLYKCSATLTERYREDNLYVMILEVYTGLQRYQRREHYRLNCNIELKYRVLAEKEAEMLLKLKTPMDFDNYQQNLGHIKGITLDISGGGMRFVSAYQNQVDDYVLAEFTVPISGKNVSYSILSKIISTREVPNKKHTYEHRVKFENISSKEREMLIKFIFEEERRYRKNEKG
mgnify:FL=1